MPLMRVSINDRHYIVDSPDTRTAKAWAKQQVTIEVADATAMDIRNYLPAEAEIVVLGSEHEVGEDLPQEVPLNTTNGGFMKGMFGSR